MKKLRGETAAAGPWSAKLASAGDARSLVRSPQHYFDLLKPLCSKVDLWHTTYYHPLEDAAAIVDFLGSE